MADDFDLIDAMAKLLVGVLRQTGGPLSPKVSIAAGNLYRGLGIDRDADVATAGDALRKALGIPGETPAPSLAERVTACLLGAGFRALTPAVGISEPSFTVLPEGDLVEVALHWAALNHFRGRMLATYASALRSAGIAFYEQDGHLYVHEHKADRP